MLLEGQSGFLYYLPTGPRATWGSVTTGVASGVAPSGLAAIGNVGDVKIALEKTKADGSSRSGGGWKATAGTLRDAPVSFKLKYDLTDAGQLALLHAFMQTGIAVPCAILDQAKTVTGAFGLWADFEVTKMEKTENLEGIQEWDVELCPSAFTAVPPQWVTVAGS